MTDERWLHDAILDDTVVADLLLRLKDSLQSSPPSSIFLNSLLPTWGLRQPRSKPSTASPEKIRDNRYSPTSPLSWTVGGGCGGGGGGSPSEGECHESFHRFRSKVSAASDTPTTSSKLCKRKKTFAQLKEEEISLLKEQIHLKKELETLRVTWKEQSSINENLKRIKLDLQVETRIKSEENSFLNRTSEGASSSKTEDASEHCLPAKRDSSSCQEPVFMLPDLNMAPDEDCELLGLS